MADGGWVYSGDYGGWVFLKIGFYIQYQTLKIIFMQNFQNRNKQLKHFPFHKIFYMQKTFYILPNTTGVDSFVCLG